MADLQNEYTFHIIDYVAFGLMLIVSAACGAYFGFIKPRLDKKTVLTPPKQQRSSPDMKRKSYSFGSAQMNEYLLGSGQLKIFPVAMSLVASYISGVTILGTPAEIYTFGTQYGLILIPIVAMGFVVAYVYVPVFASLKLGSSYEYLELRYNRWVRTIISIMFVFDELLFLPIIIYVPALAFSQVTGVNITVIGFVVCIICVFYTFFGGMRAVVSTDAWQIVVMFIAVFVITIVGIVNAGGFGEVFETADRGGRIIFGNLNPSPYERQTIWAVLIGGFFYWTSFNSVNQTMVQRYMSVDSLKSMRASIVLFIIGTVFSIALCCFCGLLIYHQFRDCDPKSVGLIQADDQIFVLYVMQTVNSFYGLPGLFIAGVFGAALSSLSVVLNSTAAVIFEDICKGGFNIQFSERGATIFVKSCVLVLGAASIGFLFIVEKLGSVLGLATSLTAIAAGTTFGVFTLGMLNPYSNSKGAMIGGVAGALLSGWVSLGTQVSIANGDLRQHTLPVSIDGCLNMTIVNNSTFEPVDQSDIFPLYRLSYHWINPIGVITVLLVGSIVSYLTGPENLNDIDPELISPVIHRFLPESCFNNYGMAYKRTLSQAANHVPFSNGAFVMHDSSSATNGKEGGRKP